MKLPIPVNVITGALGVGKTTAIQHLLAQRPPEEKWAVLVNEFGTLGIDAALLEAGKPGASSPADAPSSSSSSSTTGGLVIRELAGGCLCCALSGPLGAAIAQLIRAAKPDRLIIEPSGMGHPAGLLDVLSSEHLRSALRLHALVCLVDVRAVGQAAWEASETYRDQVNAADILVGHKQDVATEKQQAHFWEWARQLYPPKMQVLTASHGELPAALLHVQRCAVYTTLFSDAHGRVSARRAAQQRGRMAGGAQAPLLSSSSQQQQGQQQGRAASNSADLTDLTAAFEQSSDGEIAGDDAGAPVLPQPLPGQPLMFPSTPPPPHRPTGQPGSPATGAAAPAVPAAAVSLGLPAGHVSCGWLFHEGDMFHRPRLQAFLQQLWPHAARVKGIFRVGKTSYVVPILKRQKQQPQQQQLAGDTVVALESVSYRRESRLEVILSTIATRPQPAASCVSVSASSCPSVEGQVQKQLDALSLQPGMQVSPRGADAGAAVESGAATAAGCEVAAEERLHAALDCARLGDWSVLHTCLMELLV